jgi:hypothetical protein
MDITIYGLEEKIRGIVRSEFECMRDSLNGLITQHDEKPIKRIDVAKMYDVSLVTVHAWMKQNILTPYKINGRTYFKKDEVIQAMKQIKQRKKPNRP